jgi:hypothetical protein
MKNINNLIIQAKRKVFLLSVAFLVILGACKKKDHKVGAEVLDPNQALNSLAVDTFNLKTFTILEDSAVTSNPTLSVLGSYNDPAFGKTEACFYTQFRLAGDNPNFGDITQIVVDSFVLGLEYRGFYGSLDPQTFEVYKITEDIYKDTTYYAFTNKTVDATNLMDPNKATLTPAPSSKIVIGVDNVDPQLRLYLDTNLAKTFITEASIGNGLLNNTNFVSYFKGLKVKVNNPAFASGKGALLYFDLNDPLSKMTIYYKQAGISKRFDFLINSDCADFTHVDHDDTGTNVAQVIQDTVSGQTQFYAQSFRSRAVVQIPGLSGIPKKTVIQKAELILPIQYQDGSLYPPGSDVSVATIKNFGASEYFSLGVLGTFSNFTKNYSIDIRQYVQAVVNEEIANTQIIISPRLFVLTGERIIFNGPNTPNKYKPKLKITYTKY